MSVKSLRKAPRRTTHATRIKLMSHGRELSIGLHTAWIRAQDREQRQRTAEAAVLHRDDDDDETL